ncbi:MAG: hypothetical protein RBU21_15530, partial [FCB group bacterium]|nr:hypothetical protein [FCB group bacterium]
ALDPSSLELYERAVRWPWPSPSAHAHYGYALGQQEQVEGSMRQMELALRGLDTGDLYYGLGAMALRLQDYAAAERWFEECVYRWPSKAEARELLERARRLRDEQGE